jgi:hypothetical protein
MNAEMHLTPEAPEWVIAALTAIGTAAVSRDLQAVERALGRLPDTLDVSMRSIGAEMVKGLAQDIASSTTAAICGRRAFQVCGHRGKTRARGVRGRR